MSLNSERRNADLFFIAAASVSVAAMAFLAIRAGFGFDACEYFIAAEDWLEGRRPYKDFFFTKTPGILFLTAMLFKFISSSAVAIAFYIVSINTAWAAAAVWAAAPLLGVRLARWVFPLSLAAGFCCMINFWNTEQPLTLLVALAAGLELRNRPGRRIWSDWTAGLLLGMATLFKLFALLAVGSIVALIACRSQPLLGRALSSARLLGGFAIVLAAVFLWARSAGIAEEMWMQSVSTPIFEYKAHTKYLHDFLMRAGWLVIPIALGMSLSIMRGWQRRPAGLRDPGFIFGVLGLPFLLTLLKNQAAHYVVPMLPFAAAWAVWASHQALERTRARSRKPLIAAGACAALLLAMALAGYKRQSLARILLPDSGAASRDIASELARWVGEDERVIFINAGPSPHVTLYWLTGERSYPWPFYTVSGFSRRAMEEFGFEKFYAICADSRTRMLGMYLDGPMDETLPWVFTAAQLEQLRALLRKDYAVHPELPNVHLRKGSAPLNPAFRRGPYRGEPCQKENLKAR